MQLQRFFSLLLQRQLAATMGLRDFKTKWAVKTFLEYKFVWGKKCIARVGTNIPALCVIKA